MTDALFEHVNYTVADPDATAAKLVDIFGWKVRWTGPSLGDGYTVHVGTDARYIALYSPKADVAVPTQPSYERSGGLNHIGILVDDLDAVEARVKAAGYETHSHQEYEPGKRFYFHDRDQIEFEVVSYN